MIEFSYPQLTEVKDRLSKLNRILSALKNDREILEQKIEKLHKEVTLLDEIQTFLQTNPDTQPASPKPKGIAVINERPELIQTIRRTADQRTPEEWKAREKELASKYGGQSSKLNSVDDIDRQLAEIDAEFNNN